jgi:hypothetical protein
MVIFREVLIAERIDATGKKPELNDLKKIDQFFWGVPIKDHFIIYLVYVYDSPKRVDNSRVRSYKGVNRFRRVIEFFIGTFERVRPVVFGIRFYPGRFLCKRNRNKTDA